MWTRGAYSLTAVCLHDFTLTPVGMDARSSPFTAVSPGTWCLVALWRTGWNCLQEESGRGGPVSLKNLFPEISLVVQCVRLNTSSAEGSVGKVQHVVQCSQKKWKNLFSTQGFPGGSVVKVSTCQCRRCRRHGFSWVGKIPWGRKWQPIPVFLPGKSHGQRSLAGYSPQGPKRVRHVLVTKQHSRCKGRGLEERN